MKAKCTLSTGNIANFIVFNKAMPVVGKEYTIESIVEKGSAKQNRTLHPLIDCFYTWMMNIDTYQFEVNGIEYDFRCASTDELKTIFKIKYGKGADSWEYVNDKYEMVKIYDLNDVPDFVIDDFKSGNRFRIKAVHSISWKEYNKAERADLITKVLNIMRSVGVDSNKFTEIQDGISE